MPYGTPAAALPECPVLWGGWWAHQDSNLGPKDSGLCGFHRSLDYAFIIFRHRA